MRLEPSRKFSIATIALVGLCAGPASLAAQVKVFRGGTIIDGTSNEPIQGGSVVVNGDRIEAVQPESDIRLPADAQIIDVTGKFVIPGLIDGNVHFFPWPSWTYIEFLARYEGKFEGIIEEGAQIGVTGDGRSVNSEIGQRNVLRFTPAQLRAMVRAVHDAGKIIQSHQGSAESLRVVVESGFDRAQHCAFIGSSRIYESTIELMLERNFYCGTQWAPLTEDELRQIEERSYPSADAPIGVEGISFDLDNAIRLIEAGVPQLMTTDTGTIDPDVAEDWGPGGLGGLGGGASGVGEDHFLNMRGMRQRGMTPMRILQAATRNVAAAYRKLDDLGTLEAGKLAALVVLDADPLEDIENVRKISMVVQGGNVVDREALPRNPILTSSEAIDPGAVRTK